MKNREFKYGIYVYGDGNTVTENYVSFNGGNAIIDNGENMIAFNYGEGNHLFGILIGGNPEIVVGNFIGGNLGKEFPPVIPFPS